MYLVIGLILIIFIVSVFIATIGILNEKIKNKFYLFVKFSFNISIACIFLGGISFLYAYFVFDEFKNFKIILISIFSANSGINSSSSVSLILVPSENILVAKFPFL